MSEIQWDKDELEKQVIELFMRQVGVGINDANASMHDLRTRFELAGTLIGRTLAVVNHEGPIGADIAFKIKWFEDHYKERCLRSVGNLWGPGGKLREHFSPSSKQD